jgi:hypothetical protein
LVKFAKFVFDFNQSITLNIFILGSYSENFGNTDANERLLKPRLFQKASINEAATETIFLACGIAMTVCAVFVVMFFLLKRAPLVFREAWKDDINSKGLISYLIGLVGKILKTVFTILQSPEIVYYLAYGGLAVIGTVVHPFFFAFHLTEILFRYTL